MKGNKHLLVSELAEAYAAGLTSRSSPLLEEIESYTRRHHPHAHMLTGHVAGRVLSMLSRMISPQRILEIGTFTGYSAICLAEGLSPRGVLHTIESREDVAAIALGFFDRSPFHDRIQLHIGDAHALLDGLDEVWDLVFLDADKTGYIQYYESLLPRLRPGGWMIADNVLFHGQVLEDQFQNRNAAAIDAFNRHVAHDDRVEQAMLTIRDGWMLIRKKTEIA